MILLRGPFILLNLAALFGATEIPSIAPQVSSVFPHGGQRGASVVVEIQGSHLQGASTLHFVGRDLQGVIESASFRSIRARIQISPAAQAGRHDFRIVTPRGAWFGVFWVGTLREAMEAEPNGQPEQAQAISLPALVNGRADGSDADYYRFHARAGQTIAFDVTATRLGSALDPVLTIFDHSGREVAYNDDAYAFKDARLVHRFETAGEYVLLVSASFERSSRDAEYRLLATSGPFATGSLPLGARRGSRVEATIHGWNLEGVDRVWLDSYPGEARILERRQDQVKIQLDVPAAAALGAHQIHLASGGVESPVPVRFEIGDLPEVTVRSASAPVSRPVTVNGEIPRAAARVGRVQWIEFEAPAGARYEFRVEAWRLGQRLDPVITLYDSEGRLLLQEDDPAPNSFIHHPATHDPRMVYVFSKAGRYRLQVRDAAYEGGGRYRLTIAPTQPDFEIEVRAPQLTVYSGREANLLAVLRRTGGVHRVEAFRKPDSEIEHFRVVETDGWREPIQVLVEGLPDGVTVKPAVAAPQNTVFKGNDGEELFVDGTLVEIPVHAAAGAKSGLYEIRVRASGSRAGKQVDREALVLSGLRAYRLEPAPEQKLYLNVVAAPPLLWNAPSDLRISKGGTAMLRAGIVRLDGSFAAAVEPKSALHGFSVGHATAGAAADEVEIPVTALEGAPDAAAELVLVATFEHNGRRERVESPPITLRLKP